MSKFKWIQRLVLLTGFLSAANIALAQEMSPMVAVPDTSKNGFIGCYRVQGTLYGPYRMSFCLRRNSGSYQVSGGGLNCNGSLDWYDRGKARVEVDLYRSKCGSGMSWSGDSLSCTGNSSQQPATLNCLYQPVAGGYKPTRVVAKRT